MFGRGALRILAGLLFFSPYSFANLLISAPPPYPQSTEDSPVLWYAYSTGIVNAYIDTGRGFLDLGGDPYFWVDITLNSDVTVANGQVLSLMLKASSTALTVTYAGPATGNLDRPTGCLGCTTNTLNKTNVVITKGTKLRMGIAAGEICSVVGCGGATNSSYSASVTAYVGAGAANADISQVTGVVSESFTLRTTNVVPTISCASTADASFYFPGDRSIYINLDNVTANANSGATVTDIVLAVKKAGTPDVSSYSLFNGNTTTFLGAGSGFVQASGFDNASDNSDNTNVYGAALLIRNAAGIIGPTTTACTKANIRARSVSGLLQESKCFIATAAYQDPRALPVMLLRKFRDRILSQSILGRVLIRQYYAWSPAAAEWAWTRPWARLLALRFLTWVEVGAALGLWVQDAVSDVATPYLDQERDKLKADDAHDFKDYSVRKKKELELNQNSEQEFLNYAEKEKQKLAVDPEQKKSFIENKRPEILAVPDRESPIQVFNEGREKPYEIKPSAEISQAFGLRVGVDPGMRIDVPSGPYNFTDIYGNTKWVPDVMFRYEYYLAHSDAFASLGLSAELGYSTASGPGRLGFAFNGSDRARTRFSFHQVPALLGGVFRLNTLKYICPYGGAAAGGIPYFETRDDGLKTNRGMSWVGSATAGVAIWLGFLDPFTVREAYASGVQRGYLTVEYTMMKTFSGDVTFERSGLYAGVLFSL